MTHITRLIVLCPLFLLLLFNELFAATDKYRLTYRDNPSTSIVVAFNAINGNGHTVYYGPQNEGQNTGAYPYSQATSRQIWYRGMNNTFVRIAGLAPGTRYYFVVADDNSVSEVMYFETVSMDPNATLSFVAGGDSRKSSSASDDAIIWANQMVAKLKPDAVLFGGDMTNGDSDAEWIDFFNAWQYTKAQDGRMTPIVAAQGNHEASPEVIVNLFDVPDQDNSIGGNQAYYALTFGDNITRNYTLNSDDYGTIADQGSWLENDLQSNLQVSWKMAQYHQPIIPHEAGKPDRVDLYDHWATRFYNYGVRVAVECDAHVVKETVPVKPTGNMSDSDQGFAYDDNGTVFVGEGTWRALRSNNDNHPFTLGSASFNQVKWILVNKQELQLRTVKTANVGAVAEVANNDRATPPAGLDVWDNRVTVLSNSVNPDPIVNILNPSNGSTILQGATTIAAEAYDADGTITKIDYYLDNGIIGSTFGAPHELNYNFSELGTYLLRAIATDNDGNTSSTEVSFTVSDGQELLLANFTEHILTFSGFGGSDFSIISNPHTNTDNPTPDVGRTTQGNETWAGIYSNTLASIDFSLTPIFEMQVYAPKAGQVIVKFEDGVDNNQFYELTYDLTTINQWTTLSLDFSDAPDGEFEKLVLFFDFGNGFTDTYYFDEIKLKAIPRDCQDVAYGNAYLDDCGDCVGGTTGKDPCITTDITSAFEAHFSFYPNPTTDKLFIDFGEEADFVIEVLNAQGYPIFREATKNDGVQITTENWPPGAYILIASNGFEKLQKTIIKE